MRRQVLVLSTSHRSSPKHPTAGHEAADEVLHTLHAGSNASQPINQQMGPCAHLPMFVSNCTPHSCVSFQALAFSNTRGGELCGSVGGLSAQIGSGQHVELACRECLL